MRHKVNKFKLRGGKDANDMLLRKLALNFVMHGSMVTTEKKGKALSSYLAKLVEKTKEKNEANKNYLLHHLSSIKVVNNLFDKVGPVLKDTTGGYLTVKRLQQRYSDGAMMVKLTWVKPIMMVEEKKEQPKDLKTVDSSAEMKEEKKAVKRSKTVTKTKK